MLRERKEERLENTKGMQNAKQNALRMCSAQRSLLNDFCPVLYMHNYINMNMLRSEFTVIL